MASNRVFFSNVPFTTSEDKLRELFAGCGTIIDFRPFTKPRTNVFKGMGVCEFATEEEASYAIKVLLDVDVDGRPLWVSEDTDDKKKPPPSRTPSTGEGAANASQACRVFFSNVPFTTSEETLIQVFQEAGDIDKLLLFQDSAKGFRGMGVCVYDTPEAAAQAIATLRDVDVDGRPLWVSEDSGQKGGDARQAPLPSGRGTKRPISISEPTEVFFSNVSYSTTEETLREVFSKAGAIKDFRFFTKSSGESRGMGVVTFEDHESVQWAVQNLRDTEVDDRPMWVATHTRNKDADAGRGAPLPSVTSCRVFFSNVPFEVEEETLQKLFQEVGNIKELTMMKKQDGSSRGMGHCIFTAPSMAAAAIRALRDRDVGGRPIWIAEDTKDAGRGLPPMQQPMRPAPAPAFRADFGRFAGQVHQGAPSSGSRVYFSNVPFTVSEFELERLFKGIGPIVELNLFKKADGSSRGMGNCIYKSPALAAKAIRLLRDQDVGGRPILVKEDGKQELVTGPPPRASSAPPRAAAPMARAPAPMARRQGSPMSASSSCRVFFSNVPYEVTADELTDLFQQVGIVMELNLFRKDNGQSRGMGHCVFEDPQAAEAAIRDLLDTDVGGRPIWISADSRGAPAPPSRSGGFAPVKAAPRQQRKGPYGR
eukprot:TRINITY_DN12695_c0_g1_i1.p1 TRINITY_DN12695_c0_g1~~TRINITY_DN12695_c0_g1_i1.p1  ORF type:complete len:650 (+),score=135.97 TRINITY_DN12695_c0_g1_i1:63-2012(+)